MNIEFEFAFFHDVEKLPSYYQTLFEKSAYEYTVITESKFILLNGKRIPVTGEYGEYSIYKDDVKDYLRDMGKQPNRQMILDTFNSIMQAINLPETNTQRIPVIVKKDQTIETWNPKPPILGPNTWISIMIEKTENKIIATYRGSIFKDEEDRKYSGKAYLEISPQYRGKGLCTGIAKYTYDQLANPQEGVPPLVHYLCLLIGAAEKVGACRCYTSAALSLGFTVYSNEGPLPSKDNCTVYESSSVWHMIIVPPFTKYKDDILQTCSAFEI